MEGDKRRRVKVVTYFSPDELEKLDAAAERLGLARSVMVRMATLAGLTLRPTPEGLR